MHDRSNSPLLLAALFTAPALAAAPLGQDAPPTAAGIVFADLDGDGRRGPDEPVLRGVRVSNGVDVVATDEAGRFELGIEGSKMLFVIEPRGFRAPLDELFLPRFYHALDDVGDEAPLTRSFDFALVPRDEPEEFSALLVADPQPYTLEEVDLYGRKVISELVGTEARFAIVLGDLVGDDLSLFEPLNRTHALLGIPFYNVIGNHDLDFTSPDDAGSTVTYRRVYGPTDYAFQFASAHFIVLNDVIWKGFDGYGGAGKPKTGNYEGGLRDEQLAFVANYLAHVPADELVVLCMHIPLEGNGIHRVPQTPRLLEILSSHPRTLSLSGHTHLQRHWLFGAEHGYAPEGGGRHHHFNAGTASGSWYRGPLDELGLPAATMSDGTPCGTSLLHVTAASYAIEFRASRRPAAYQMSLFVSEPKAGAEFTANVFNGGPESRVEFRMGPHAPWRALERSVRPDPHYEAARLWEEAHPHGRRSLPNPSRCSHLWAGRLPEELAPGLHLLEVRARDAAFGLDVSGTLVVRVE